MQADQLDLNQHHLAQKLARRFILAQLITTIVLSMTLFIFDITVAYSSLAGGIIATLANAWFALKVFRTRSNETPETLLATFYVGEIYKFVLTGAMFIIVFVLIRPLNVVALLGTYLIIHLTPAVVNVFGPEKRQENIDHMTD